MLILWIRKNKARKNRATSQADPASLPQHNEAMQRFSLNHPKLESTGGRDILTPEGDILATVREVRMALNCQN